MNMRRLTLGEQIADSLDKITLNDNDIILIKIPKHTPMNIAKNVYDNVCKVVNNLGFKDIGFILMDDDLDVRNATTKELNGLGWYRREQIIEELTVNKELVK